MSLVEVSRYVLWVQVGLAAFASLMMVFFAIRASRPRYVRAAALAVPILSGAVAVAAARIAGFGVSVLALSFVVVAGAIAGVLVGRAAKMGVLAQKPVVKPSAATAWVTTVAWSLAAFAIALIGPNASSAMMAVVLGCAAMGLAETIMHLSRARKVG